MSKWAELGSRSASISRRYTKKMFLCCCWPVHKCVTALSCFDTLIVAIFAYKSFNVLYNTLYEPHWLNVFAFLFFTAFLVCQVIGTVFIILAHKKQIARYCYPRIALISGLVICAVLASCMVFYYFMGGAKSLNVFLFSVYEWFFEEPLDEKEKIELKGELKLYASAFLALSMSFALYSIFELLLTRKFYQTLNDFSPISQNEPSAPHPPYNPEYTEPPKKVYPNFA